MKTGFHAPPDQAVLDNYFKLASNRQMTSVCWLYGMLATFGVHPQELKGFSWNSDGTITVLNKKRKVKPLHPQWLILFSLKEKQPSNIEDRFEILETKLNQVIKSQKITVNITDLQLAYRLRRSFYQKKKADLQKKYLSSLVLS